MNRPSQIDLPPLIGNAPTGEASALMALADHGTPLDRLYQLLEQLEAEKALHQEARATLLEFEQRFRLLVENIPDLVYCLDPKGTILTINKAVNVYGYRAEELIGHHFAQVIYEQDRERVARSYLEIIAQRQNYARTQQFRIVTKSGEIRWFEANCSIQFTAKGEFIRQEGVCRDITQLIEVQQSLLDAQNDLEEQVRKRTHELTQANLELQKEIIERKETERILRERENDLQLEKSNLQEANTAMKVLLKRREEDKKKLEEHVLYNVKKLLLPYLDKLSSEMSDERHHTYLKIIETNLNDITSGFSRRLSMEYHGLTGSEIKVANFIRQGKKNWQIATLLGLSVRTVEAYRMSIRNKLRIQNKKVNLCTYLMSIS